MRHIVILFIDIVLYLLMEGVYLIFYLFGWRFISHAGKMTGDIIYLLSGGKREKTEKELKFLFSSIYDDNKIKDITKKSFEHYYMRQLETVFFGSLNKKSLNRMMDVEGIENLDLALSRGKGIILLLSHFGSFLLPLPFLGYRGYKVNQITGKQKHTSLFAERLWMWRKKEAERLPVGFIQVDKFLRPLYKALNKNEIVAIAFDGRDGSVYQSVRFFFR